MEISISAIVLIGKEVDASQLSQCINSLKWCNEIVRVDTTKIRGSFSEWRNEGLKKAKGEWILYVDTDEIVTTSLRDEVIQLINNAVSQSAYAVPRRNYIFGKELKHSSEYPKDYQIRLFKKTSLKRWHGDLHEEPIFSGKLGYLKNALRHYKNITLSQMLEKTNKWSEIEAQLLFDSGHPPMNILRFGSVAFREFWLRMIKGRAFLDGTKGIIYAIYQVYSRLITYSKLWEKQLS